MFTGTNTEINIFSDIFQQELALSLGFQEDLRHLFASRSESLADEGPETIPGGGGLVDTQYIGLGARGIL